MNISILNNQVGRILLFVFVANIFYDDPSFFLYKRIIYAIFIYVSVAEIVYFLFSKNTTTIGESHEMPFYSKYYIPCLILFISITLLRDLLNPNLNFVTLFNNPFALLSTMPILMFSIGVRTKDLSYMRSLFYVVLFSFFLVSIFPYFGKVKFYQGYICACTFIPIYILSVKNDKHNYFFILIIIVSSLIYSQLSDYRIIALRVLLFASLYLSMILIKKSSILKLFILLSVCFFLYHFIANLADLLEIFKSISGVKDFDDDDTRLFLFEELFSELNTYEYLIGRGFLGTYYSEYFFMILTQGVANGDHYERYSIEVGSLELILKGGFFWYILYTGPLFYSALKGLFSHYKDPMIYAISIFIITELLLMFIEVIPYFNIQFTLMFFMAGYSLGKMYDIENKKLSL